jgi:hypothetical protein
MVVTSANRRGARYLEAEYVVKNLTSAAKYSRCIDSPSI